MKYASIYRVNYRYFLCRVRICNCIEKCIIIIFKSWICTYCFILIRYILMFSLLSAPYLLHINVKLNFIIHKLIEAKDFYGTINTLKNKQQLNQRAYVHLLKKVRFIIFLPILKHIFFTFLNLVTSKYNTIMTHCLNSAY